jgi:hypothetical protein
MGWTATALLSIKRARAERARAERAQAGPAREGRALAERLAARPAWLSDLTRDVLSSIEPVEVCATRAQLEERYIALAPAYLDHGLGLRRSTGTVLVQGFCGVLRRELVRRVHGEVRRRVARAALPGRFRAVDGGQRPAGPEGEPAGEPP